MARQRGAPCSLQWKLMAPLAGGGMQKLPSLLPPGTGEPPAHTTEGGPPPRRAPDLAVHQYSSSRRRYQPWQFSYLIATP